MKSGLTKELSLKDNFRNVYGDHVSEENLQLEVNRFTQAVATQSIADTQSIAELDKQIVIQAKEVKPKLFLHLGEIVVQSQPSKNF